MLLYVTLVEKLELEMHKLKRAQGSTVESNPPDSDEEVVDENIMASDTGDEDDYEMEVEEEADESESSNYQTETETESSSTSEDDLDKITGYGQMHTSSTDLDLFMNIPEH